MDILHLSSTGSRTHTATRNQTQRRLQTAARQQHQGASTGSAAAAVQRRRTWSQGGQRAVLLQPRQRRSVKLVDASCRDRTSESVEQRLGYLAQDVELPVLQRPLLHVASERLLHLVVSLPSHWCTGGRKLGLTGTMGK